MSESTSAAVDNRRYGTCAYCRKNQGVTHSGVFECSVCWNWRKLNGPAARYWVPAIDRLFFDPETGSSGPDLNDIHQWKAWGILDEMEFAILMLKDVRERYQAEIDAHKRSRE